MNAVITGATSGIGRATAIALARREYDLLMVGRDPQRGEDALEEVRQNAGPGAKISLELADLSEPAHVRLLAERILAWRPELSLLINSAAIVLPQSAWTADGLERAFAVNHLAPFLLTRLLIPALQRGSPARIVTVSSQIHAREFDSTVHHPNASYRALETYRQTKLDNILMTRSLASRLDPREITANCLHPGVVKTRLLSSIEEAEALERPETAESATESSRSFKLPAGVRWFVDRVRWRLMPSGLETAEEAAAAIVQLACAEEFNGMSGEYFKQGKPARPAAVALDNRLAEQLWTESERLLELDAWTLSDPLPPTVSHPQN